MVIDGPGTVGFHEDAVVCIGDQIFIVPGARIEADIRHANDGQTIPAFGAHGAGGALQANEMSGFAIRQIAA